jgi:hypothetical protein
MAKLRGLLLCMATLSCVTAAQAAMIDDMFFKPVNVDAC